MNHQEKKSYEKRNIEIEFVEERESQNLSDDFKHLVEVVPGDVAVVLRHLHRRVPGYLLRDCVGEPALPQPGVEVVPPAMEAYASGILHCFRYPIRSRAERRLSRMHDRRNGLWESPIENTNSSSCPFCA